MPTVTIAITHEQTAALDKLRGQLRQPFTDAGGGGVGWDPIFARLVDNLVWMVDKPDTPGAWNAARWLRDAGFLEPRALR